MIKIIKKCIGVFVGKFVLKSQVIPIGELTGLRYLSSRLLFSREDRERLARLWPDFIEKNNHYKKTNSRNAVQIKRKTLTSTDGSKLDTVELSPIVKHPKEYVIYGWGRNNHYEMFLPRLAADAINMNKKVITFNYRNVGDSKGSVTCEHDLVSDYSFQIKRLLAQGVKPEQIKCYGHSLGGAVATIAVHELHRQGTKGLKLFNDRSFGNLIDTSIALFFKRKSRRRRFVNNTTMILATMAMLPLMAFTSLTFLTLAVSWVSIAALTYFQYTHFLFDKTVGMFLEKGLNFAMHLGGWYMHAAPKYDSLPMNHKTHMLLHHPKSGRIDSKVLGKRTVLDPHEDRVIFYEDSLHRHLPDYKHQTKTLKHKITSQPHKRNHVHQTKLLDLSMVKVSGGDHNSHPCELKTWYPHYVAKRHVTGQERIYHFFDPDGGHLSTKPKKYRSF